MVFEYMTVDFIKRRANPEFGKWVDQQVVWITRAGKQMEERLLAERPDEGEWTVHSSLLRVLNELGAEGWELATGNVRSQRLWQNASETDGVTYVLKRQRPEPEGESRDAER